MKNSGIHRKEGSEEIVQAMLPGITRLLALLSILMLLFGCAKGGSSGAKVSAKIVVRAVNANSPAQAQSLSAGELESNGGRATTVPTNTNNSAVDSILSTAPEKMIVYLQSISGESASNGEQTFWVSPGAGGSPITLQSGSADVSALGLGSLSIPAGNYSGVKLVFARVGQIKGCVQGRFGQTVASTTGPSVSNGPTPHGNNQYTNEATNSGASITAAAGKTYPLSYQRLL